MELRVDFFRSLILLIIIQFFLMFQILLIFDIGALILLVQYLANSLIVCYELKALDHVIKLH